MLRYVEPYMYVETLHERECKWQPEASFGDCGGKHDRFWDLLWARHSAMLLILSHQVFTNNPARLMQAEGGEGPNSHSHASIVYSKHKTCFKIGLITFLGNSIQWGGLWKKRVSNCILEPPFTKMEVFDKSNPSPAKKWKKSWGCWGFEGRALLSSHTSP